VSLGGVAQGAELHPVVARKYLMKKKDLTHIEKMKTMQLVVRHYIECE